MASWLLVCVVCFGALNFYKLRPGPVGKIQKSWPVNTPFEYDRNFYNLVLFAHPKCGCTYASLVELEKLLNETNNKLKVKVFFYHPKGSGPTWSEGESRKLALKLPATEVYDDVAGIVARNFGAMTSGQVMVYSPGGELTYAGGITESRGHIGDNQGIRSIASVIATGMPNIQMQPTFGCMLFSAEEIKEYSKYEGKN